MNDKTKHTLTALIPNDAGIASEAHNVGKRWASLLDALDECNNRFIATGTLVDSIAVQKIFIIHQLTAEGWRVSVGSNDKHKVLPPLNYHR